MSFWKQLFGKPNQTAPPTSSRESSEKINLINVSSEQADRIQPILERFGGDNAKMYQAARQSLENGQTDEAIQIFEALILSLPDNAQISGWLGIALVERANSGVLAIARISPEELTEGQMKDVEVYPDAAARLERTLIRSRDLLDFATRKSPDFALAWVHLGICSMMLGQAHRDKQALTRAVEAMKRGMKLDAKLNGMPDLQQRIATCEQLVRGSE